MNILKIKNWLLDLLFPQFCLFCHKILEGRSYPLCQSCENQLVPFEGWVCPVCFKKLDPLKLRPCPSCQRKTKLSALYAAQSYQNPLIRRLILNFKYKNIYTLAEPLGHFLIKGLETEIKNLTKKDLIIMAIPLTRKRLSERGYNQSVLIAQLISKYFQLNLITDALIRIRFKAPQVKMQDYKARKNNILGSFEIKNRKAIKNKTILLIDDVYTTGATLNEAAKVLRQNGAKKVLGIVIARD